jgi:hypothetical protein
MAFIGFTAYAFALLASAMFWLVLVVAIGFGACLTIKYLKSR